jgi:hypothetical protein
MVSRVRHLFIVSRNHPWLYAHLRERFEDDPNVEVIIDRRVRDRRLVPSTRETTSERRKGDRRRPLSPDEDLGVRSHYIVEV